MLFRTSIALFTLLVAGTSAQDCTADGLCDKHERCGVWKEEGECYLNKEYMLEECPASCSDEDYPTKTDKACKDHHLRCPVWADLGECAENPTNMKRYCPLSCGICTAILMTMEMITYVLTATRSANSGLAEANALLILDLCTPPVPRVVVLV